VKLRAGVRTDVGRSRARNEDSYLVQEPLYAIADGMGGHRGGDVASSLALESLQPPEGEAPAEEFHRLVEQIKDANRRVLERGEADRNLRGMGTTLTAILAADGKAHVAHVGDSRAYMLREGSLQQLTEDHTLVQRMIREGRLTEEEAHTHPQRSILTRALGVEDDIPIDELTLDLKPGDRLLLCSDGLTNMIGREAIQEILQTEDDPQRAADRLVEEANRAGGDDNITVIVLDVVADQPAASGADAEETQAPAAARQATPIPSPGEAEIDGDTSVTSRFAVRRRAMPWRRVALWMGVALSIVAVATIGARIYINHQWYVGDDNGRVAIYQGVPASILGFDLSHVQETTELPSADVVRYQVWRDLPDGITAKSFQDAESIVSSMRQQIAESQSPPGSGG
jgi:PPM family protein phosphatase